MLTHLVLFRPRPDLTEADRRTFVDAFKCACREIPTVRNVQIGVRVTHGAGYEQLPQEDFTYVAALDFDDLAGLRTYLEHPAHQELGARFGFSVESSLVYDYERRDVDDLDGLISSR
jgi:hypothetical protein